MRPHEALRLQGVDITRYACTLSASQLFEAAGNAMSVVVLIALVRDALRCIGFPLSSGEGSYRNHLSINDPTNSPPADICDCCRVSAAPCQPQLKQESGDTSPVSSTALPMLAVNT